MVQSSWAWHMHPQYWNFNEERWLEFVEINGVVMEIDTVIEEAVEELHEPLPLQAEQLAMLLGYHFRLAAFRTIRKCDIQIENINGKT